MSDDDIQVIGSSEEDLRKQAIHSLKKKENFRNSLIAYVLVNAFLIGSGRSRTPTTSGRSG